MSKLYDNRLRMFPSPELSLTALKAYGTKILTKEYGELTDFESGCWAAVLGHCRKEITEVICESSQQLIHTHQFFDSYHSGALVKELSEAAGFKSQYRGTFISSGSEAVSLAVVLAELLTGRKIKLSFSISYHGTSPDLRMPREPTQWIDIDIKECLECNKEVCDKECGKLSKIDFSKIAAFVFEPGNSGGLALIPPSKLIKFLTKEIKKEGGLVIANEVTTGFGRTGKWFGFQHYEVFDSEASSPDFISVGKGLGNGYPISGLLVKLDLAKAIESTDFRYVQSHIDDPLGCSVARKVIEVLHKQNIIQHGNNIGSLLRLELLKIGKQTGGIEEIRGIGLMNVLVLSPKYRANEVFRHLLEKGFFTGYSDIYNYIHLYPPLIIQSEEIYALCNTLKHIFESSN